jgi:uncharacterized protein YdaU (DUF1376 family)
MSKAPAMPMYWDAYLADTTHLTTEEHGAYMLLLAAMWRRNGSVLDDDRDNARILGLTPAKWRKVKARFLATISGFHADGETITQEKLRKIWENTQEKIAKNVVNGAKGGRAAASKINDLGQANATETLKPKATIPEPEPEPQRKDTSVSLRKKRGERLAEDWFLPMDWGQWAVTEGWTSEQVKAEAEKFKDYWIAKPGAAAVKLDWQATWRNWIRNSNGKSTGTNAGRNSGRPNPHRSLLAAFGAESADDDGAGTEYGGNMRDITPASPEELAGAENHVTPKPFLRFGS